MQVPAFSPVTLARRLRRAEQILVWCAPALIVPALRLSQDPKDSRWSLFTRDFTTLTLGAGIFFAGFGGVHMALNRLTPGIPAAIRRIVAFGVGLTGNMLYAGIGALKVANWVSPLPGQKNHAARPVPMASPPLEGYRFPASDEFRSVPELATPTFRSTALNLRLNPVRPMSHSYYAVPPAWTAPNASMRRVRYDA